MAERVFATNRRAFHDYHILENVEAGLALTGTEVKSIRAGKVQLREGYAKGERGEAGLQKTHIPPTTRGNAKNTSRCGPASCFSTVVRSATWRGSCARVV